MRLLDDETPEVRLRVSERLALCGGDISEWMSTRSGQLSPHEENILIGMLSPARRENLQREWIVPSGGASAMREDWDLFEAMLRVLSDFLHDGITVRQSLSDGLDLLAEEAAENNVTSGRDLAKFLFKGGLLAGNDTEEEDPRNSDLAWAIAQGRSHPLGLGVIFILVGRRMGFEVEGVDFPGHFLCRVFEDGYPLIIDGFDHGRPHLQETLLESTDLSRASRTAIRQAAGPGTILLRVLENLMDDLTTDERAEDARLIRKLCKTLA